MPTASILTISDTRSAGSRADTTTTMMAEILGEAGFEIAETRLVPDEFDDIAAAIAELAAGVELVITSGGTGLAPRDVTPEATRSVLDREAPGLRRGDALGDREDPAARVALARGRRPDRHDARHQPAGQPEGRAPVPRRAAADAPPRDQDEHRRRRGDAPRDAYGECRHAHLANVASERAQEREQVLALARAAACGSAPSPAAASPPCQRIASARLRARPSCRKRVWRLTVSTRPMPHSGAVRHSDPVARPSGRPSARPGPMSCSEQVGVRVDVLRRASAGTSLVAGPQLGQVARRAADLREQSARRADGAGASTSRRAGHRERARVERDALELVLVDLGRAAASARAAHASWPGGQFCVGEERARDADVAVERAGVLLLDASARWPSSRSARARGRRVRASHDAVRAARDPVAVGVVGIGARDDRRARAPPRAGRGRTRRARRAGDLQRPSAAGRTRGRRSRSDGASSVVRRAVGVAPAPRARA